MLLAAYLEAPAYGRFLLLLRKQRPAAVVPKGGRGIRADLLLVGRFLQTMQPIALLACSSKNIAFSIQSILTPFLYYDYREVGTGQKRKRKRKRRKCKTTAQRLLWRKPRRLVAAFCP